MIISQKTGLPKGIRQRGPVFHVSLTINGVRRTGTAGTIAEALVLRDELRGVIGDGRGKNWTLQTAIEKCEVSAWSSAISQKKLRALADEAARFFGPETPLRHITTNRIDDYTAHLQKSEHNSGGTINRKLAALSKVLSFALQRTETSGLTSKPHLQRQREGVGRIRVVTKDEELALYSWCAQFHKPDHADAITVLVDTGLRGSELWRLEVRDIDFMQGLLSIWQTKANVPRSIPMTKRVREIMTHRCQHSTPHPFPYANDWLENLWDRLKLAMELSDDKQFVPYALRHTCASRLIQRGVNLRVVQEWLGHKTITVTMKYAHMSPANLMEAVKVLNPAQALDDVHDQP